MRVLIRSFSMFLRQIVEDRMLFAVLTAPALVAVLFRFGAPRLEAWLCLYYDRTAVLSGYYRLFDLFLAGMTPFFFSFASSMVMLTEYDESIAKYTAVTPVGKRGYVVSRLVFPAAISFLYSLLLMFFFTLSVWPAALLLAACALSCLFSMIVCLLVVAFSHNRVEGLAIYKLSGMILLGLFIPFFLRSGVQYLFSFLPSFWLGKLCLEEGVWTVIPALLSAALWLWPLYGKFEAKFS